MADPCKAGPSGKTAPPQEASLERQASCLESDRASSSEGSDSQAETCPLPCGFVPMAAGPDKSHAEEPSNIAPSAGQCAIVMSQFDST